MPTAIEIFAGCGGLSSGLVNAGFQILSAVEINSVSAKTYQKNHPEIDLVIEDVCKIKASYFLNHFNLKRGELDLLAGCSPCQGFSRSRKGESANNDPRNQLVFEFLRLVRGLLPKTIFMENVPGLINTERGLSIFVPVKEALEKLGYHIDYDIIDTANYGIPQFRKHFVLLGSRYKKYPVHILKPTHTDPRNVQPSNQLHPRNTVCFTEYFLSLISIYRFPTRVLNPASFLPMVFSSCFLPLSRDRIPYSSHPDPLTQACSILP